jgi:hypothetical protein
MAALFADLAAVVTAVRSLVNEPAEVLASDTEIQNWIKQAAVDISTKALCYETIGALTLVAGTMEIAKPTDCLKVYAIYHNGKGIMKIHPRQIAHLGTVASGTPLYWYEFGGYLGFYPVPDAGAAAATTKGLYSKETNDITVIPETYQPLAVLFAASKYKLKELKPAVAAQYYQQYLNSLMFHRQDLYERGVDSKDMFKIPDRTVAAA